MRTGLPEEVTFIDWQIAHYCSPVVDILYLIMLNTTREMREKHFQRLLTDYHDELTVYLQALGAKPNSYTWDTLQRQLKTYGKYGLGMACLGVPILVSDPGAAKDIDNCFENGDGLSEMLTPVECTDPKERDKRICDVVEECLTLGVL